MDATSERSGWASVGARLDRCIRCGLCLPACPTYGLFKSEMDGPRGRIALMRALAEGRASPQGAAREHLDLCLGCRACEAACPSGVEYGALLGHARGVLTSAARPGLAARLARWLGLRQLLPHPRRLRALARATRWARRCGLLALAARLPGLPAGLRRLAALVPPAPDVGRLPRRATPSGGQRKGRVALFRGCVQDAFLGRVNAATVRVLRRNGFEVWVPPAQTCCGAAAHHVGETPLARELARRNLAAFAEETCDAVVTNAGGCGAMLAEYGELLGGSAEEAAALDFGARVRDVSELVTERPAGAGSGPCRLAYADSCHLRFGQRVVEPPRALLRSLPGAELVELRHPEVCCGSAGVFNLLQGPTADRLLREKVEDIRASGVAVVATSNPGCQLQIARGVREAGLPVEVAHFVELLDRAYASAD